MGSQQLEKTRGKAATGGLERARRQLMDPVRWWIVERGKAAAGRSCQVAAGGVGGPTFSCR